MQSKLFKISIVFFLILGAFFNVSNGQSLQAEEQLVEQAPTENTDEAKLENVQYYSTSEGLMPSARIGEDGEIERLFLVNFLNEDGSQLQLNVPFYTGDGVAYPEDATQPSKAEYSFVGWMNDTRELVNLSTLTPTFATSEDVATITLTAKYEKNIGDSSTFDTFTIQYIGYGKPGVATSGEMIALTYQADLAQSDEVSVASPTVAKYQIRDEAQREVMLSGSGEKVIIVAYDYVGTDVNYTVTHNYPNLDGSLRSEVDTLSATPKAFVTAPIVEEAGFTFVDGHMEGIVAEDGSTQLSVNYKRNRVFVVFETTDAATQVPAADGLFGETVDVSYALDAQRAGYTLTGYQDQHGNFYDATTLTATYTLPTETLFLTAVWEEEDVKYIVNYYVEKDGIIGTVEDVVRVYTSRYDYYEYSAFKLSDEQINSDSTYEYYSSSEGRAEVDTLVSDLDLSGFINTVPGNTSGLGAAYAYREYSGRMETNNDKVSADGTTIINLYYTNKIYLAEFQLANSSAGDGEWTILGMTLASGVTYTYPPHQFYPVEKYRFTYKYGQDISGLWPHAANGATFVLNEGFDYYGWGIIGSTFHDPTSGVGSRLVLTGNQTKIGLGHIPVARLESYETYKQVNFNGYSTTVVSNLYTWVEVLEGEDLTGQETIVKDGITFKRGGTSEGVLGGNHEPITLGMEGFTPIESLTEVEGGLDLDGDGDSNDEISVFYYTRNAYDIHLNLNNGTGVSDVADVFYQENIQEHITEEGLDLTPTKPNAVFDGWYTTSSFDAGTEFNFDTTMPAGNIQLHAKWIENEYDVTFDFDMEGVDDVIQHYANYDKLRLPLQPSKTGYIFDGWKNKDSEEFATEGEAVTEDATYVAQWLPISDLDLTIIHRYTDVATGQVYEVGQSLQKQSYDVTSTYFAKSSGELIAKGFPSNFYVADDVSKSITIGLTKNEIVFTYTTAETLSYTVEYVDAKGVALLPSESFTTMSQIVNANAYEISGYTPRTTRISRDIVNNGNVLTFVYDTPNVEAEEVLVNFYYSPESGSDVKLAQTSFAANLGEYIADVKTVEEVNVVLTQLLIDNPDLIFSTASIVTKYVGDSTTFNLYFEKEAEVETGLVVVPTSTRIPYDSEDHRLSLDMFAVYVDGILIRDLDAAGITLAVTDVDPSLPSTGDPFDNNVLNTFVAHDVAGIKNLWVKATMVDPNVRMAAVIESEIVAFTHEIYPLDVQVSVNDIEYPITMPEPAYSYEMPMNQIIAGDDIQVGIDKVVETPSVGLYIDGLVANITGTDVHNYNFITRAGDINIYDDVLVDEDEEDLNGPDVPGDGIADIYQTEVIYRVVNGTWSDASSEEIREVVTFYLDGVHSNHAAAHATLSKIPTGMIANQGFVAEGTWDVTPPMTMQYTKDVFVFTHTFAAKSSITPPTGDNTNTTLYVALMGGAVLVGALFFFLKKRSKKEDKKS